MSLITVRSNKLTAVISTLGAELQSIRDENGVERLWQGDPAFWASRAPILFPIAGGLREDRYILEGQSYPMPKHGYVRKLEWKAERVSGYSATFLMTEKHEGFPFDYEYRVTFTAVGNRLEIEHTVRNTGDRVFVYGMGAHEAYATPEGIEEYELEFDEAETFDDYVLDGNLIKRQPIRMAEGTRVFPLKTEYFAVDALVFRTLKSRGVTLRSKLHGRTVRVEYPEHDVLMLWTKPGAGYICIEPWINAPDFVDSDMLIEHKQGCVRLAPAELQTRIHSIILD